MKWSWKNLMKRPPMVVLYNPCQPFVEIYYQDFFKPPTKMRKRHFEDAVGLEKGRKRVQFSPRDQEDDQENDQQQQSHKEPPLAKKNLLEEEDDEITEAKGISTLK